MTGFALVVAVAALAVAVWWYEQRRQDRTLRGRLRRSGLVTLHSGEAFSGVLFESDTTVLVLRGAEQHLDGGAQVPVDGELVVRWADVAYVQVP